MIFIHPPREPDILTSGDRISVNAALEKFEKLNKLSCLKLTKLFNISSSIREFPVNQNELYYTNGAKEKYVSYIKVIKITRPEYTFDKDLKFRVLNQFYEINLKLKLIRKTKYSINYNSPNKNIFTLPAMSSIVTPKEEIIREFLFDIDEYKDPFKFLTKDFELKVNDKVVTALEKEMYRDINYVSSISKETNHEGYKTFSLNTTAKKFIPDYNDFKYEKYNKKYSMKQIIGKCKFTGIVYVY